MSWLLLILSGLLETAWAIGLKLSEGLSRPGMAVLTIAGMIASFVLLAIAARDLPIGTAYAVWVGIGALGTAVLGIVVFHEPVTAARMVSLVLLIGGIVGLKLTG